MTTVFLYPISISTFLRFFKCSCSACAFLYLQLDRLDGWQTLEWKWLTGNNTVCCSAHIL